MESLSTTTHLGHRFDTIDSIPDTQHTFKMEDFNDTMSSASPDAFTPQPSSLSTPPPVVVQSRPAKKRKSWGQELPEPKTSLPPRKRAKTDDEKEQRRIERIKRNRAAAHNSRERKRQETETLAVALARANNELNAYRRLHGPLPDSVVLPEVHLCTEDPDESSPAQIATTPAPSLVESHGSQADAQSPASPADSIFYPPIKQEESSFDTTYPSTLPPAFDNLDAKSSLLTLDPTQHSAVSVQPREQPHDFASFLVEQSLSLHDDLPAPDVLQNPPSSYLDTFAFTDGALDASFNAPLNFSFDDLIDDSATFAVDAQMSGAV